MPHYGNGESPAYETFHESSQHKIFYSQNLLLHLSHKASCFHACKELSVLLTLFFRHLLYESFCIFAYFLKHHIWLNFICKDSTFHLIIQSFLCFLSLFYISTLFTYTFVFLLPSKSMPVEWSWAKAQSSFAAEERGRLVNSA